jgi:hypothetical protein
LQQGTDSLGILSLLLRLQGVHLGVDLQTVGLFDGFRVFDASLDPQEGRGFRQHEEQDRSQDETGDRSGDEHGVPAGGVDEEHAQQGGEHRTNVVAGHQGRGRRSRLAPGPELGDQRDRGRQGATQPGTGKETPQGEPCDVRRERQEQGEHREQEHCADQHPSAPQLVCEEPDHQGTDGHADQPDGGDLGGLGAGEVPGRVVQHRRDRRAEHDEVEAVEQDRTIQHRAMTQPALRRVGPRWTELRDAPPVGTVGSWLSWWSVVSVIVMSLSVRGAAGGLCEFIDDTSAM